MEGAIYKPLNTLLPNSFNCTLDVRSLATMGTLKLVTLLCCTSFCFASHQSHIIPVEGYESELQDLGEHTITHDTPVKVIKITKTVAVKVPIPYPVKVVEKVPYPVHVSKPYPVPVPQIVKIPQPSITKPHHEHQRLDSGYPSTSNSYNVHENHETSSLGEHNPSEDNSYDQGSYGNYQNSNAQSYVAPNSFYGSPGGHEGSNSFESTSYDDAIQKYLDEHNSNGQNEGFAYY